MRTHVWCLIAPLFLVSVRAGLHDHVSQSFYETPQSSSPAPERTQSSRPELVGMKEIVLFLTPNQVQTLQAAGALVQPYPEYETEFAELQEQFRQSIEQQNEQQYKPASPTEAQKQDTELENYYKLFNIQEINDDLGQTTTQATEGTTAKEEKTTTTPRYKYTKSRQQYKETTKKPSRTKVSNQNTNTEYVRFLPNYETENIKMVPYQALPLSPYQLQDAQGNVYQIQISGKSLQNAYTQGHEDLQRNAFTKANEETQLNGYTQANTEAELNAYTQTVTDSQLNTYTQPITEAQVDAYTRAYKLTRKNTNKPAEPEVSVEQKSEKPQAIIEVPAPVLTQKPVTVPTVSRFSTTAEFKETLESIEGLLPLEQQQEKPETPIPKPQPTVQTPTVHQDKFSLLLAPLYQHQAITETIARQREELLSNEFKIHKKLQQIKESPQYDYHKYESEIEELAKNLGKQNALAKIEAISKTPSVLINQESQTTESYPVEFVKSTEFPRPPPVLVHVPKPLQVDIRPTSYTVPELIRPIPFLVSNTEQFGVKHPVEVRKRVPTPGIRYVKVEKPYIVHRVSPIPDKRKIPLTIPVNEPEELSIIRHIWEH